ncbi:MAG: molybdenum cofactor biosynthesis protein MoaD [Bacteroidetes bacterium]|nr:MAG: molybdenum cofactor biosynthesis protein MoaD [Bacteroidota bacterium]
MPRVSFTTALKRFYPGLESCEVRGKRIDEILNRLDEQHPGLKDYILDEQGELRQHVNIFIGSRLIRDKQRLLDPVGEEDEIFIMQALSGG